MSSNTVNRSRVRKQFAALLETAVKGTTGKIAADLSVTGDGKLVRAVYKSRAVSLAASPAVAVISGGSKRQRAGIGTRNLRSYFRLDIYVFMPAAPLADWSTDQMEDAFDLIEKQIADFVSDNQSAVGYWNNLQLVDDFSNIAPVPGEMLGGQKYVMETCAVLLEAVDG